MARKGAEANFIAPQSPRVSSDIGRLTRARIEAYRARQREGLESEAFKQKKRLADARRALRSRQTKHAREEERIARNRMDAALNRLSVASARKCSIEIGGFTRCTTRRSR